MELEECVVQLEQCWDDIHRRHAGCLMKDSREKERGCPQQLLESVRKPVQRVVTDTGHSDYSVPRSRHKSGSH